jgi:hypothetical protein
MKTVQQQLQEIREVMEGRRPAPPPFAAVFTVTPSGSIHPAQAWDAEVNRLISEFNAMKLPTVSQVNQYLDQTTQIPEDTDLLKAVNENLLYMKENPESREAVLRILSVITDAALDNAYRELNTGLTELGLRRKLTREQIEALQNKFTPEQRQAAHDRLMKQFI